MFSWLWWYKIEIWGKLLCFSSFFRRISYLRNIIALIMSYTYIYIRKYHIIQMYLLMRICIHDMITNVRSLHDLEHMLYIEKIPGQSRTAYFCSHHRHSSVMWAIKSWTCCVFPYSFHGIPQLSSEKLNFLTDSPLLNRREINKW